MASDSQLVQRCVTGDPQAWAELIDRYERLIYSVAHRYGLSNDEAGDVFQATCMKLLTELASLRDVQALPAWLIRVAANHCLQSLRDTARHAPEEALPDDQRAAEPDQEEMIVNLERQELVRGAVRELKPRCRQLIQMLFFDASTRPYAEIARELGLAEGSIGFIRGRCLKQLRQMLEGIGAA